MRASRNRESKVGHGAESLDLEAARRFAPPQLRAENPRGARRGLAAVAGCAPERETSEQHIAKAHRHLVAGRVKDLGADVRPSLIERAKKLGATLRRLERNGIIGRELINTRPIAVEYRITPLGKTLRHPVEVLLAWADVHLPAIEDARARFDTEYDGD